MYESKQKDPLPRSITTHPARHQHSTLIYAHHFILSHQKRFPEENHYAILAVTSKI